ncbi:MAG: DUF402 domain-containing protein [Acidobacteriota bacterium]|nr:MAG: DUF402 domain-containing protein [Acidobacteriota bacterium]
MINKLVKINARKFDFSLHRSWNARLVSAEGSLLTLLGQFEHDVNHPNLGHIKTGTHSLEYYWLDRWYSVFRFHEPEGAFRNFYCNVNQPPVLTDEGEMDYVDLDMDILVRGDLSYEILDREEFRDNSLKYRYPELTVLNALDAIQELVHLIEGRRFPFDSTVPMDVTALGKAV